MLERLYFADLVLADMTIPNGNVYYEVGIRHASQKTGCVLLAADWSKQLFDVVQMRTVRYPLPEGEITDATAAAVQGAIKDRSRRFVDGISPMRSVDPGLSRTRSIRAKAITMREPARRASRIPDQDAGGARGTQGRAHEARAGADRSRRRSARHLREGPRSVAVVARLRR